MSALQGCKKVFLGCLRNIRYYSASSNDIIKIVEVGPRDGLQNEPKIVPTEIKLDFIDMLVQCGLKNIEATSFVSPRWVPQMADNVEIMKNLLAKPPGPKYSVLVPNMTGLEKAIEAGVDEIAVFGAASESFTKKNLNCSIDESLEKFTEVVRFAKSKHMKVRGYVSCVVGCPYEGPIRPYDVAKAVAALFNMGCYEVSLGDTIGVGTPGSFKRMLREVNHVSMFDHLALHCHDTFGQALANIFVGLDMGITTVDSSVAGLGGCPYAKGASGNVATEDVVYMLNGLGVKTNIDMVKLMQAGRFICDYIGKEPTSRVNKAAGDRYTNAQIMKLGYCDKRWS